MIRLGYTCYADAVIKSFPKRKVTIIPCHVCPEKFISVAVNLPIAITPCVEDRSLNEALVILGHSLKGIYSVYAKKNVFTEPEVIFKPDQNSFLVKIGILSKEKYKIFKKLRQRNLNRSYIEPSSGI